MKTNNKHNELSAIDQQSKTFFTGGKFNWSKSEAAIWAEMDTLIDKQSKKSRSVNVNFKPRIYAIAASLLFLIGIGSFLRFYTTSIISPAGQHQTAKLPDGSIIELNAESEVSYHPYWWRFNRSLTFEVEAYFEVQKGKKFTVKSKYGTTQVLGTSFNIYSRNEIYNVTCLTGSVRVISKTKQKVILEPNSKADVSINGEIEVVKDIETFPVISWKKNIFLFTAVPVQEVFFEIERQFGVKITSKISNYALYTGNFDKKLDVEEILGYVCPALGLSFERKSANEYEIIQDTE